MVCKFHECRLFWEYVEVIEWSSRWRWEVWQMFAWKIGLCKCSPLDGAAKTLKKRQSIFTRTDDHLRKPNWFYISLLAVASSTGGCHPFNSFDTFGWPAHGKPSKSPLLTLKKTKATKNSNQLLPRNTSYLTTRGFERNGCVVWLNFFVCHSKRWVKLRVWLLNF